MVNGRVAEVGPALAVDGAAVVDADGLWVTPGFVDAHSHADAAALTGDGMEARALAGVTTEIVGQDGLGLSFATGATRDTMAETLVPIAGELPDAEFADLAAYLEEVDRASHARVASLVPQGTIRSAVMGTDLRDASVDEIAEMRRLVERGVAQGAPGLSTGLSYAPALASNTDELVAIAEAVPAGTLYVTHLRDYGTGLDRSLDEAVEICRRSPLDLHLSHLHVSGPGRDGAAEAYLPMLASTGATWDSYPYTSGCTFIRALMPSSVQHLAAAELGRHLAEPGRASRLAAELDAAGPGATVAGGWDTIFLAGLDGTAIAGWEARTVAALAAATRSTSGAVVVRAIQETSGRACIVVDHGHLANVHALTQGAGHLVGSDGIMGSGIPHPRATNAFFRFLSWAATGTISVSVEEMVARMTGRTAERFRLPVGRLEPGRPADLLVIDPEALDGGPDFGHATPASVVHAILSGEPNVTDGRWRGEARPGLALRATGSRKEPTLS
ncbi:N-acyl-D-amino-acid deacylase family protein [Agromyces aerolatus]|uniref:N-acyl-D-amino-acid deacylase family protein n=1 Tax=Agromyces sp. LY-1074 TaxID=3074080 RepID=UPI00285A3800|nr:MULTISPECIES: amidohydrolase family protein [unclassified Agromyces]MDR5699555.1 amidohydrolase family protein [Agromyces sp. LY-1074]MDR5705851.1 amidohydrolase family protein [Agromyces sp. LY-1358]